MRVLPPSGASLVTPRAGSASLYGGRARSLRTRRSNPHSGRELLDTKGARYTVLELDLEEEGAALRARLGARTGRTSVPSVWIGGDYCGGLNDGPGLAPLDADGLLEPRLRAVGAIP